MATPTLPKRQQILPGYTSPPPHSWLSPGSFGDALVAPETFVDQGGSYRDLGRQHPGQAAPRNHWTMGKGRDVASSAPCRRLLQAGERPWAPAGVSGGARTPPPALARRCRGCMKLFANDSTINHAPARGVTRARLRGSIYSGEVEVGSIPPPALPAGRGAGGARAEPVPARCSHGATPATRSPQWQRRHQGRPRQGSASTCRYPGRCRGMCVQGEHTHGTRCRLQGRG